MGHQLRAALHPGKGADPDRENIACFLIVLQLEIVFVTVIKASELQFIELPEKDTP